jgi:hypothetical protein
VVGSILDRAAAGGVAWPCASSPQQITAPFAAIAQAQNDPTATLVAVPAVPSTRSGGSAAPLS